MKTSQNISSFLEFLRTAEQEYHIAIDVENEANDETQDLLHAIEFGTYNLRSPAMIKKIKQVRTKRRKSKNDEEILSLVVKWSKDNEKVIKSLEQLLGAVRKAEVRIDSRSYMPRTDILDSGDRLEE